MSAKAELIERLRYLDAAAALPALIDNSVAPSEHNNVANLLRKGLSIVAFNILEDFIKNRANETLDILASSGISYSNLPENLQKSAILDALSSLQFQAGILKKDGQDYKLIIQEETKKIASTRESTFYLSKYSLLSSGSNVSATEVSDFLKAFGIPGGWATMKVVSDAIGGGIPDLASAFNNASQRRHSSAHSASFVYSSSWLTNLKNEILAICSSLDILISAKCRQAAQNPSLRLVDQDFSIDLNYRFLELHGVKYKETKSIGGRSQKNWDDLASAFSHHNTRLSGRKEFLIVLDSSRRINDWLT